LWWCGQRRTLPA